MLREKQRKEERRDSNNGRIMGGDREREDNKIIRKLNEEEGGCERKVKRYKKEQEGIRT